MKRTIKLLLITAGVLLLQSCYSVAIRNSFGEGEPDPLSKETGLFQGLKVNRFDTIVGLKATENFTVVNKKCNEGFYIVQYRVTLGGVLLSGITFGKKRKIKVSYVCLLKKN